MYKKHIERLMYGGGFLFAADNPASWASNLLKTPGVSNVNPVTQASVASLVNPITYRFTKISGVNAITGFQLPSGFKGEFTVIPTGIFTGATGGAWADDGTTVSIPIGLAFTAVVGKALIFWTDGLLCYPSYTA